MFAGISKGSYSHPSCFLVFAISSSPKGDPCAPDVPALFGDPNPISVLQQIKVGWFDSS